MLVDLGAPRTVLSSAPCGGGLVRTRYVLNHQVPSNPRAEPEKAQRWEDPGQYLGRIAAALGLRAPFTGLMTAVSLRRLVTLREERDGLWVEAFVTAGVSHAVRAGEPAPAAAQRADPRAGTINIILVTNARLTTSAMVSAVQVATESKTAVLLHALVPSSVSDATATGTGTDATVIVSGRGPVHRYSGTHTRIGTMIGRLVGDAVSRGLARDPWRRPRTRRP